jgi:hypothetical protein
MFGPRTPDGGPYDWSSLVVSTDQPLQVSMHTRDDRSRTDLGPATGRIAGHDVWYLTESSPRWIVPGHGSLLFFSVGRCDVSFRVDDRDQVPYAELKRMVEQARFGDCTKPGTWTGPPA